MYESRKVVSAAKSTEEAGSASVESVGHLPRGPVVLFLVVVLVLVSAPSALSADGGANGVDSEVLGVSAVPKAHGAGAVMAEIRTDEVIRVQLRVIRYQKVVSRFTTRWLRPGRWLVSLALPDTLKPGRARVQVRMEDRAGSVAWYAQPIRVPARRP